jgi:hypothetical protein
MQSPPLKWDNKKYISYNSLRISLESVLRSWVHRVKSKFLTKMNSTVGLVKFIMVFGCFFDYSSCIRLPDGLGWKHIGKIILQYLGVLENNVFK